MLGYMRSAALAIPALFAGFGIANAAPVNVNVTFTDTANVVRSTLDFSYDDALSRHSPSGLPLDFKIA